MNEIDLAWLAGLLEGEGSFTVHRNPKGYEWPQITLSMTDQDVVARAAAIVGLPQSRVRRKSTPRQDQFLFTLGGKAAIVLMRQLAPLLGLRRGARVRHLLDLFGHRCPP